MSAYHCSVDRLRAPNASGIVPHIPYLGEPFEMRDVERERAIQMLVDWFDLEQMARGLREISGVWDRYVAQVREELLAKNQHAVTRWWNRRPFDRQRAERGDGE